MMFTNATRTPHGAALMQYVRMVRGSHAAEPRERRHGQPRLRRGARRVSHPLMRDRRMQSDYWKPVETRRGAEAEMERCFHCRDWLGKDEILYCEACRDLMRQVADEMDAEENDDGEDVGV